MFVIVFLFFLIVLLYFELAYVNDIRGFIVIIHTCVQCTLNKFTLCYSPIPHFSHLFVIDGLYYAIFI
jgi:hypothetical protein